MKLKFKIQPYQTAAVESVVDCFVGQPNIAGVSYRMDPGKNSKLPDMDSAFKNAEIVLSRKELLENILCVLPVVYKYINAENINRLALKV